VSTALLDANVLLALAWPNHQFHAAAHGWFGREAALGWATCALTQLAFVRLSANPAFTSRPVAPFDACRLLAQWTARPEHAFWGEQPPPQPNDFARTPGHQQVNDCYLLRLAEHHRGKLVTFDVRLRALAPDPSRLVVLTVTI
jgi:toxin-antitoxin system PIN domain toxin